jgi:MYXO-CTERM domain-containing protein
MRRLLLLTACCFACAAGPALADGDPASDYLIGQSVFLPFNTHVDKSSAAELTGLLAASKQAGFEIRVAVISSKVDLGAVPVLYRKPQQYARFLGQELFYWYKHELLVVMPNGFGVSQHGKLVATDDRVLSRLQKAGTTDGTALVDAAIRGTRALARKHGVALPAHVAGANSSSSQDRVVIAAAAGAAALLAAGLVLWRRRR